MTGTTQVAAIKLRIVRDPERPTMWMVEGDAQGWRDALDLMRGRKELHCELRRFSMKGAFVRFFLERQHNPVVEAEVLRTEHLMAQQPELVL